MEKCLVLIVSIGVISAILEAKSILQALNYVMGMKEVVQVAVIVIATTVIS